MTRWASWVVMAAVLAVAMFVGVTEDRAPRTENDRVNAIAAEVRCPTCESLSAAESDAAAAQAVRDEIRTRLRAGQDEPKILAFLAGRYGDDILLRPDAGGVAGLVWVLPVVVVLFALGGLVAAMRRSRRGARVDAPSTADRDLVEEALRS
jgi:cytochrome c-type biogenesis protein CcmH